MVQLVPMSESDLETYLEQAIRRYAYERIRWNLWHESDAQSKAQLVFDERLPQGLATPNNHLYRIIRDNNEETLLIGYLWFAVEPHQAIDVAFVYDIVIDSTYRRRGYGRDAFRLLEEKVREHGLDTIFLNVFGDNHEARAMYESLGYAAANLRMIKKISDTE